ncbi:hypothetical protein BDR26DRAFT_870645 [Obelidium mucronatum]|nr:hypothetical protein BDR26DRAFT_870645 [Obelidium mucronatum]
MAFQAPTSILNAAALSLLFDNNSDAKRVFEDKLADLHESLDMDRALPQQLFTALVQAMHHTQRLFGTTYTQPRKGNREKYTVNLESLGKYRKLHGPMFCPPTAPLPAADSDNTPWYGIKPSDFTALFRVYVHDPVAEFGLVLKCPCGINGCQSKVQSNSLTTPRAVFVGTGLYYNMSTRFMTTIKDCMMRIRALKVKDAEKWKFRAEELGVVADDDVPLSSKPGAEAKSISWDSTDSIGQRMLSLSQQNCIPFLAEGPKVYLDKDFHRHLCKLGFKLPFNYLEELVRVEYEEFWMRLVIKHDSVQAPGLSKTHLLDLLKPVGKDSKSPFFDTGLFLSASTLQQLFVKDVLLMENIFMDSILTVLDSHYTLDETFRIVSNLSVNGSTGFYNTVFALGRKSFSESLPALLQLDHRNFMNNVEILTMGSDNATYDSLVASMIHNTSTIHLLDIWHKVKNVIGGLAKDSVLRQIFEKELYDCLLEDPDNFGYRAQKSKISAMDNLKALDMKYRVVPGYDAIITPMEQLMEFTKEGRFDRSEYDTTYVGADGRTKTGRAAPENVFHHMNTLRTEGRIGAILLYCLILVFSSSWNLKICRRLLNPHPVKNAGYSLDMDLIAKALECRVGSSRALSEVERKNVDALNNINRVKEDFFYYSVETKTRLTNNANEKRPANDKITSPIHPPIEKLDVTSNKNGPVIAASVSPAPVSPASVVVPDRQSTPPKKKRIISTSTSPLCVPTSALKSVRVITTKSGEKTLRIQLRADDDSDDTDEESPLKRKQRPPQQPDSVPTVSVSSLGSKVASVAKQALGIVWPSPTRIQAKPVSNIALAAGPSQPKQFTLDKFFITKTEAHPKIPPNPVALSRNVSFLTSRTSTHVSAQTAWRPFDFQFFLRFRESNGIYCADERGLERFHNTWIGKWMKEEQMVVYSKKYQMEKGLPESEMDYLQTKTVAQMKSLCEILERNWVSKFIKEPTDFSFSQIVCPSKKAQALGIVTSLPDFKPTPKMELFLAANKSKHYPKSVQDKHHSLQSPLTAKQQLSPSKSIPKLLLQQKSPMKSSTFKKSSMMPAPGKLKANKEQTCKRCNISKKGQHHPAYCKDGFHSLFKKIQYPATPAQQLEFKDATFDHPKHGKPVDCYLSRAREL